ncbi:hypothetical protein CF392_11455 [Tamilnaduibacter salinus]|uniref:Z-ring associated protein G n=1 Tax=Tamilnaduibacter salinus TaxID=1484056 RepID=A0A2A2I121_9GAMM|nr:YhcB family protein [Tamilnaduibacter salinus]PAV25347.1 hypothetical protein CF392_11455 [Tamilnaduibacter salinus]
MSTIMIVAIAIGILIAGLVAGYFIGRSGSAGGLQQRRLEQQIDELRSEYTRYQAQVNEHFVESAHMLRRFNDAYRDINRHMARGASRLCHDEDWTNEFALESNAQARLGRSADDPEPPRDYAPKADPEEKGTLAEDYGLDNEPEDTEQTPPRQ